MKTFTLKEYKTLLVYILSIIYACSIHCLPYAELWTSCLWPDCFAKILITELTCDSCCVLLRRLSCNISFIQFCDVLNTLKEVLSLRRLFRRCKDVMISFRRQQGLQFALTKMLRTKNDIYSKVFQTLGRRPRMIVRSFASNLVERGVTGYYATSTKTLTIINRFLVNTVKVVVRGAVCDLCCGVDERISYRLQAVFPDISRLVLNDWYGRGKHKLDVNIGGNVRWLTEGIDWVITSLPYGKGVSLSNMMYSLLNNFQGNILLKAPVSVVSSRTVRANWWKKYIPNYCLALDPIIYEGYKKASINSEVILVWLAGHKAENTKMYNMATMV